MSKMLKLAIQGIRSFGADEGDQQIISLDSPLTLIVGQNGCGKTTIIESLKYATAGDLPKGQGQAFVHDPKMAGHSEVYAQVKLMFLDVKGDKVTVVRSLKSTQKSKDLKTSTIDQTITRVDKNGEKRSISQRCSDVNAEMSRSLGVSKAILENVIFCHQEDSTWPLDEPKKLKEKFDAIFDATKYNKCLEDIRKLHKDKKGQLALLQKDVDYLQRFKVEAEEKRNNLSTLERQLGNLRDEIKEYNQQLEPISDRLNHIHQAECNEFRMQRDLATYQTKLEIVRKQLWEVQKNIKIIYPESSEELQQKVSSFSSQLSTKERCLSQLEQELSEATEEENKSRKEIGTEQMKVGQLIEEEKQCKKLVQDCTSKLRTLARQLSISFGAISSSEDMSEYEMKNVFDQLNRRLKSLETDFEREHKECKAQEEKLQSQVNDARDKKVKQEQEVHMKELQLNSIKKEISKRKGEIEEAELSAENLTRLERESNDLEEQLKVLSLKTNLEERRLKIQSLKEERIRIQSKLEEINREALSLQQLSKIQAELDVHMAAQSNKESDVKRLKRKHNETLKHLLQSLPEKRFKNTLENCVKKLTESMDCMDEEIRKREKELTELEMKRKHFKEQLDREQDVLRENEEKVYNACGSEEFDVVVRNISKEMEDLQKLNGVMTSKENLNKLYIRTLQQESPCCPLCHREFTSDLEAEELVNDLNQQVHEIPQKLKENKAKLKVFEEKYSNLLQLKPVNKKNAVMKDVEIPNLRSKVSAVEGQLRDIRHELEKLRKAKEIPEVDLEMAKSAMSDMVLLDQSNDELLHINKEIEKIRTKMPSGGFGRTMKEALADQERIQSEMQEIQKELEKKQAEMSSHAEEMSYLREARNNITSEILKIQGSVQASTGVRERIKELESLSKSLIREISDKKDELQASFENLQRLQWKKEDDSRKLQKDIEEKKTKLDDVKRDFLIIESLCKEIEDMNMKGVEEKVKAARTKLVWLEKRKEDIDSRQKEIRQCIVDIQSELSTHQVKKRELEDNIAMKNLESEVRSLEVKVDVLKAEIGEVQFETLREEKRKLVQQEDDIIRKKSHAEGRKKEKGEQVFALERELNKKEYKNANTNYRDKYLESYVQTKGCEDLLKFAAALDFAIKHFHRERMESINAIIRELWTIVYKGNDVDSIEIRTDETGDPLLASDRRRNYSYRVVMRKKDVELDMRGRCSAGQKMLASLIIRIALAETFSTQCGILALDEPTTNLDSGNSISLSEALAEIVKKRSSQKNFQLIVITHDKEFSEYLAREDGIDYYYLVTRDSDGKSRITKQDV